MRSKIVPLGPVPKISKYDVHSVVILSENVLETHEQSFLQRISQELLVQKAVLKKSKITVYCWLYTFQFLNPILHGGAESTHHVENRG